MKLAEILKGCEIAYDGIQSIQGLTIIPLTCKREFSFDDKYASPFSHSVSNTNYGEVTINRQPGSEKDTDLLLPANVVYLANYGAQDHLMSKGVLIKKGTARKTYKDARCVESRQPGYLRTTGNNVMFVAPMKIREIAYNHVNQEGYDRLWPTLASFNQEHDSGSQQQIKDYYIKWNKDLDTFIAHFEKLDKCIGFITLYNDEIVAIDKFPSFKYCGEIWEKLVRDSYASLVIRAGTGLRKHLKHLL